MKIGQLFRFQFRLRTMFLAMIVAVGTCVWILQVARKAELQRDSVKRLRRNGMQVCLTDELVYSTDASYYPPEEIPNRNIHLQPSWHDRYFDGELFTEVGLFELPRRSTQPIEKILEDYQHLRGIKILRLNGRNISEEEVRAFTKGRKLEELAITNTQLSETLLGEILGRCRRLKRLRLSRQRITAEHLQYLDRNRDLAILELRDCLFPEEFDLSGMSSLKHVSLQSLSEFQRPIDLKLPAGLFDLVINGSHFRTSEIVSQGLPMLRKLWAANTPLNDTQLAQLTSSRQLRSLNIANCQVSAAGLTKLGERLESLVIDTNQAMSLDIAYMRQLAILKSITVVPPADAGNDWEERKAREQAGGKAVERLDSRLVSVNVRFTQSSNMSFRGAPAIR